MNAHKPQSDEPQDAVVMPLKKSWLRKVPDSEATHKGSGVKKPPKGRYIIILFSLSYPS